MNVARSIVIGERGLWAPFVFLAAVVTAALGSVQASPSLWAVALALLAAGTLCVRGSGAPGATPVALSVWGFALWLVLANALLSPAYTAAAPFHAMFLVAGFALGRRLDAEAGRRLFAGLGAAALALSFWCLWQLGALGLNRAHLPFETPATLAAVLNFALAPAIVMLAWAGRPLAWAAAVALLAAGLAATASRGGMLGLACGVLATALCARRLGQPLRPGAAIVIATALAAGWAIALLTATAAGILSPEVPSAGGLHQVFGEGAQASSVSRLELYALALEALGERPWLGIGYLGFNAVLEAGRLAVPSFGPEGITYFVHNDYLQTLLELGIPGLAALCALVLAPAIVLLRRERVAQPAAPLAALAALAATAAMAAHALVDFPFYIPLCLLLYGLALGVLDRALVAHGAVAPRWRTQPARIAAIAFAGLGAFVLGAPVAAEAAAAQAQREWRRANAERAAYWFEVARRLERRDWRYHWYAGQFWFAQAAENRRPAAARLADEAFAAGFAADPRSVRNLLGRISTHRQFGALLERPADAETLERWLAQAEALAPLDPAVRAERARLQSPGRK